MAEGSGFIAQSSTITVLFSMFTVGEAAVRCNPILAIQTELIYTVIFNSWALSSKQLPAVPADCTVCQMIVSAVAWADPNQ